MTSDDTGVSVKANLEVTPEPKPRDPRPAEDSREMTALIRELDREDATAYRALMTHGLEAHVDSFRISLQDEGEPLIPFASRKPDAFTLGAWLDGNLAGTVSFERDAREKCRHKGLLYRMYVHADASGRGIGRMLIQETIGRVREMDGLEQISLTVVSSNARAKRLYASQGFTAYALEKNALKMGGAYYDEEQMSLFLRGSASG